MKTKKILSALMVICMLIALLPAAVFADGDPVTIASLDDLTAFRERVNAGETDLDALMTADITGYGGYVWIPIGSEEHPYTGTFDGGGHMINGIRVKDDFADAGLFGVIGSGGTVKNVNNGVDIFSTAAGAAAGGIAGRNLGGTIENCFNGDEIEYIGEGTIAGGIVGVNEGVVKGCRSHCYLYYCKADGVIVGGIAGDNRGTVSDCSFNWILNACDAAALSGIAGRNSASGIVERCYNSGSIADMGSGACLGGLAGENYGMLKDSYNIGGIVSAEAAYIGGLAGYNDGTLTGCYNMGDFAGGKETRQGDIAGGGSGSAANTFYLADTTGGQALSADDFAVQGSFPGWDFTDVWVMEKAFENIPSTQSFGRPLLSWEEHPAPLIKLAVSDPHPVIKDIVTFTIPPTFASNYSYTEIYFEGRRITAILPHDEGSCYYRTSYWSPGMYTVTAHYGGLTDVFEASTGATIVMVSDPDLEPVNYWDPIENREKTLTIYEKATSEDPSVGEGWHAVLDDISTSYPYAYGLDYDSWDTDVVLSNGTTFANDEPIYVCGKLTIWGQKTAPGETPGRLVVTAKELGGIEVTPRPINDRAYAVLTINGGTLEISGSEGYDAIYGPGIVRINDGTVFATGGSGAVAISNEKLTIADGMAVWAPADAETPVAAEDRVTACHTQNSVKIAPCTDHDIENGVCRWCGAEGADAPKITAQPADLPLIYGYESGNTLSVTATASEGHTISGYQWYSNTSADNTSGTAIAEATGSSYTVPAGKNAGTTEYYYCVVTAERTDIQKTAAAVSSPAAVTVGKKALTVTAKDQSYVYNGSPQGESSTAYSDPAEIAEKVTVTGLAGSDALTGVVLNGLETGAGIYDAKITVSGAAVGSATDNYDITYVPGRLTIAPAAELTPAAVFTATGPDTGTVSGLTDGGHYTVSGAAAADFTLAGGTSYDLTGVSAGTLSVVKKGDGTNTVDSDAQTITVTKAETPALTASQPAITGGTGSIPTAAVHEISTDGAIWTDCAGETADLDPGTYYVRVKASGSALASDAQTLTITAYTPAYTYSGDPEPEPVTETKSGSTITSAELDRLISEDKTLTVEAEDGTKAELSSEALKAIAEQASGSIKIELTKETPADGNDPGKTDDRAEYDLTVSAGGKTVDFDGKVDIIPGGSSNAAGTALRTASIRESSGSRHFVVSSEPFPFTDVPAGSYYYDAVSWAELLGITDGVGGERFDPAGKCKRAQMVTFLWRAAGKPAPKTADCPFTDVDPQAYYYKALLWAYENGIVQGIGGGRFAPDGNCDRAQAVTFLFRSLGGKAGGSIPFVDAAEDRYYSDAVRWAYENGVAEGTTPSTFSPDDDCLRCQIVTFLYRAYSE